MLKFPDKFFWGSATSATQSEGSFTGDNKAYNIWDYWFEIEPYKFHNEIGPSKTSSIYKYFESDVELMKKTGHNSFRTSISWSRLFPTKDGKINETAVEFYKNYFTKIKKEGIALFINLYHFDMPMYLQEQGGFENKETITRYKDYAKACFELFGEYVDRWFTFNEPIVHVECGYLNTYHYPMEVDPKKAVQVAFNTAVCSAAAIKEFRKLKLKSKIGIILNLTPAYPRSSNKEDIKAAKIAELFANKSFLDPAVIGAYPKELIDIIKKHDLMPVYSEDELEIIRQNTVDFLGINYYQPLRVKAKECMPNENAPFSPLYYYDIYDMPGKKINPYRGWEIYPQAIYDICENIRKNYNNIEWLITENGIGVENESKFRKDGKIEDDYRIEFMKSHLKYLHKGIQEGTNCIGYQVWTFIDCWSWLNSYKNRYGLVELDLETDERIVKKSGYWFKNLSDNNGF